MVFPWGISIRVETRKAERVSQQFLTDLELGPLGWRGLWAGNRWVEIGGPTRDPVGAGTKHTHLLHERKMAKRAAKDINLFVAKCR
jgi:hypothetical protein